MNTVLGQYIVLLLIVVVLAGAGYMIVDPKSNQQLQFRSVKQSHQYRVRATWANAIGLLLYALAFLLTFYVGYQVLDYII